MIYEGDLNIGIQIDCYDQGMMKDDLPHGFEVQNTAWAPPQGIYTR